MKSLFTLTFTLLGIISICAQTSSTKRFAKIYDEKKYIITETVYEDGHKEQFITSVPLAETRKMRTKDGIAVLRNIQWDENSEKEGLQKTCSTVKAIEDAYNNALNNVANQLNLTQEEIGNIELPADFLALKEGSQSLMILNKVISALSRAKAFENLVLLEAVDNKISENAVGLAGKIVETGASDANSVASQIGYRNIEFSEHVKNDGIFLTDNDKQVQNAHLQAIYNWIFADSHTGWYNRRLLLNSQRNNGAVGLNDDFLENGKEGLVGIGTAYGPVINNVVMDPTFSNATTVVFQLVDPLKNTKYLFDIQEMKTEFITDVAQTK